MIETIEIDAALAAALWAMLTSPAKETPCSE